VQSFADVVNFNQYVHVLAADLTFIPHIADAISG
jgi:hypothetical protein